jgi:hypothetical protein
MPRKKCTECSSVEEHQAAFVWDRKFDRLVRLCVNGCKAFPEVNPRLIVLSARVILDHPDDFKRPAVALRRLIKHFLALPVPEYLSLLRKIDGTEAA